MNNVKYQLHLSLNGITVESFEDDLNEISLTKQNRRINQVCVTERRTVRAMYLCVLAGILLATSCLADVDLLLEMSVPHPHTRAGLALLNAAFMTDEMR